jgi:hypothetical protein
VAGASEGYRLAAQAEEKLAPIVAGPINSAYRKALEARLPTALALYGVLKPIADKHGVPVETLIATHMVETRGRGDPMGRESEAGATGPFQITEITRKEFKPSAQYATQVERDADIAAQHFARAKAAGFSSPEGLGMTYIAGIEGMKKWGGGADSNVGQRTKEYGPMLREAMTMVSTGLPKYQEQLQEEAKKPAARAGQAAFDTTKLVKMEEGLKGYLFGPSEEEAEASRQKRNDARDEATKHFQQMAYDRLAAEAPAKAGYK